MRICANIANDEANIKP